MDYPILDKDCKQQFQLEKELPYNLFEYDFYEEKYLAPFEKSPLTNYSYNDFKGDNLQYPIESNLDKEIVKLGKIFKTKDTVQRWKIRNSFSDKDFNLLLAFLERASVFVLRGKKEYLEAAMLTVTMIDFARGDTRYTCMAFAFVEHVFNNSSQRERLFKLGISLTDSSTRDFLQYIQQEKRSIEYHFGYTTYNLKNGIGFISCDFGGGFEKDKYKPNKDLYAIANKIADYLFEKDIYSKGDVLLSTKSPFLISSSFQDYSSVINGKAKLSFICAKETSPKDMTSQSLYFSIIEFEDRCKANAYLQLLGKERTDKYGSHVFNVVENIVYCISGRSTVKGVQSIENHHKLQRFKKPFDEIIRLN